MMDRLLGGKGNSDVQPESLTEIETTIMTQMFEKAVVNIQEAWSTIVEIDPMLDEFEVNPQFLQMVSPNETVVVVSFNTQIGDVSGMINICIPHIVLEPIIPKLSVHYWMETTTKERDPEKYELLSEHIRKVNVDAKALLGKSTITVHELLQLKQNDIISLDQKIDEPLTVAINDEPKMKAQVGMVNKRVAVQVLENLERGSLS